MPYFYQGGNYVQVFMTAIDYHYFKLGVPCIAYKRNPNTDGSKKINIMKSEVVEELEEQRLLLKKLS